MNRWKWGLLGLIVLAGRAAAEQAPATAVATFRIGIVPSIARERTSTELAPIIDYLSQRLGRPATLVIAKDYAAIRQLVAQREVEAAILFPLSYAEVEATVPGVQLIACSVRQGKAAYRGYIVARRDAPLQRLEDLRGKRFAFVDRNSTSGFLYAVDLLQSQGLLRSQTELTSFFSDVQFRRSHDGVLRAVVSGEADAGAVYDGAIAQAARIGIDAGELRILGRTDPIPHEAVVVSAGVSPDDRDLLREALLSLDTRSPIGRSVLRPMVSELRFNGFVACDASHFDGVRRVRQEIQ